MKRILITGATGFLGSALKSGLQELETVNIPRTDNLNSYLHNLIGDFDCVLHTAADYGKGSLTELVKTNIDFSVQVLDFAVKNEIPHFINCGTSLNKNVSLYALSKNHFSELGEFMATGLERINFADLKIEQMYGKGQRLNTFIPKLMEDLKNGVSRINMTEGEQWRDFIHVDDVVSAVNTLLQQVHMIKGYREIPIGTGKAITMKEFTESAVRISGAETKINYGAVPYRKDECMSSEADIAFMKSLGWTPQISIEAGLQNVLKDR